MWKGWIRLRLRNENNEKQCLLRSSQSKNSIRMLYDAQYEFPKFDQQFNE